MTLKATVPMLADSLDVEQPLAGRPNDVAFGPFQFWDTDLALLAADVDNVLNVPRTGSGTGTVDKKLITLDANQEYWLYLRGFSVLLGINPDLENIDTVSAFLAHQYIGMERNAQRTFEQMVYGVTPMVRTSGAIAGAINSAIMPPDNPNFMFRHWWILDGKSDPLFQNTDFNTPMNADVAANFWFYGFAISKSIQAQIEEPECGPAALRIMGKQGAMNLSTVMALRSRA